MQTKRTNFRKIIVEPIVRNAFKLMYPEVEPERICDAVATKSIREARKECRLMAGRE